jgi:hypothetical protein
MAKDGNQTVTTAIAAATSTRKNIGEAHWIRKLPVKNRINRMIRISPNNLPNS